jgi:hypothetical protein
MWFFLYPCPCSWYGEPARECDPFSQNATIQLHAYVAQILLQCYNGLVIGCLLIVVFSRPTWKHSMVFLSRFAFYTT